jgi:hypothetical protein
MSKLQQLQSWLSHTTIKLNILNLLHFSGEESRKILHVDAAFTWEKYVPAVMEQDIGLMLISAMLLDIAEVDGGESIWDLY